MSLAFITPFLINSIINGERPHLITWAPIARTIVLLFLFAVRILSRRTLKSLPPRISGMEPTKEDTLFFFDRVAKSFMETKFFLSVIGYFLIFLKFNSGNLTIAFLMYCLFYSLYHHLLLLP